MLVPSDLRQPGGSEGGNPGLEDVEDAIKRMNKRKRRRRGKMNMFAWFGGKCFVSSIGQRNIGLTNATGCLCLGCRDGFGSWIYK